MIRLLLVLCCIPICSTVFAVEDVTPAKVISDTLKWPTKLTADGHDLEMVHHEVVDDGRRYVERYRFIREMENSKLDKFVLGSFVGNYIVDSQTGERFEEAQSVIFTGDKETLDSTILNSHVQTGIHIYPSEGKSCLEVARGFSLFAQPALFEIPVQNAASESLKDILKYFSSDTGKQHTVLKKVNSYEGRNKKVDLLRVFRMTHTVDGQEVPFGYELIVSREGSDKGLLLRMRQGFLKPNTKSFRSSKDVLYFDRTVETKWKEVEIENQGYPVPSKIVRNYYWGPNKPGGNPAELGSIRVSLNFDWKRLGTPIAEEMKPDAFEKLSSQYQQKIDKLLGR